MKQVNVTLLPPEERVGAVFASFDQLKVGECMELRSDHEPLGLMNLFKRERPLSYEWSFLDQGPDQWLALIKKTEELDLNETDDGDCCGCCGKN